MKVLAEYLQLELKILMTLRCLKKINYVSVHGGHSGEFVTHAEDKLENIVKAYIGAGFQWVGITEHVPPEKDEFMTPDDVEAGLNSTILKNTFAKYIVECKRLKKKYSSKILIFTGFETENWSGYKKFIPDLIKEFKPDYIVGSLHQVSDLQFDYSRDNYEKAADILGGYDNLYCKYFDEQYKMILDLKPAVVGHFDLIRIFDADYKTRIKKKKIWNRITRNLELIRQFDLIMDFNLRALYKGADEPYISAVILKKAKQLGIKVVPGDDSHGVKNIRINMDQGINILKNYGFDTEWPKPVLYDY